MKLTQIMMDFLQKVGTGITIFYYQAGSETSMNEVAAAASKQIGNNVYLFPRARDGTTEYGPGIDRVEVSMQGAEMFWNIYNTFNAIMRHAILGETGTTEAIPGGIGSTVAETHSQTSDRLIKYDATRLEFAMQKVVNALNRWNCAG